MSKEQEATIKSLIDEHGAKAVKAASSKSLMKTWYSIVTHPSVCRRCKSNIYNGRIQSVNSFCSTCQKIVNKILGE